MQFRVRSKLIALICIPLIITYSVILVWDYAASRARAKTQAEELLLSRANLTVSLIDARLEQVQQMASIAADAVQQRKEAIDPILRFRILGAMRQYDYVVGVVIALEPDPAQPDRRTSGVIQRGIGGPGGIGIGEIPASVGYLKPECHWYARARETRASEWFDESDSAGIFPQPTITYTLPIVRDNEFKGVVAVHVTPSVFRWNRLPRPRPRMPNEPEPEAPATQPLNPNYPAANLFNFAADHYLIAQQNGQVIYHAPEHADIPRSIYAEAFKPILAPLLKALKGDTESRAEIVLVRTGPERVFTFDPESNYFVTLIPIRGGEFIYVTGYPEADLLGPMYRSISQRAAFLLSGLVVLFGVVFWAARRIFRPLEELDHAVIAVSQGDLQVSVPEHSSSDEIAHLSRLFNHMLLRIRQQMDRLREETEARARVENELALARRIQTDLLPRHIPESPDGRFELHATNLPANHVAGDFYDFFVDASGKLTLVIADVAGHGVAAALMMAVTRTLVRNLAGGSLRPADIVHQTNHALHLDQTQGMFVTLVLGSYDPGTGVLTYTTAGHPSPLILRADGTVDTLGPSTAPLLGVEDFPDIAFEQDSVTLNPGDTLILFTDGITEARPTGSSAMFGDSRFHDAVAGRQGDSLAMLQEAIVSAVDAYQQGPLSDDLTLLMLRRM